MGFDDTLCQANIPNVVRLYSTHNVLVVGNIVMEASLSSVSRTLSLATVEHFYKYGRECCQRPCDPALPAADRLWQLFMFLESPANVQIGPRYRRPWAEDHTRSKYTQHLAHPAEV
jgi:hypothetical protein